MLEKILLFPYYLILKIRKFLYDKGIKPSVSVPVPTICVGNIAVGGTGKTPHTEMILRELLHVDKFQNVAVLSRGYRRESEGFQQVTDDGSALMFGDEPLQIKKKFPSVTVVVDKDRIEACELLCDPEKVKTARGARQCWNKVFPKADLIILDDAFQYRKLKADMNIVLIDYNKPLYKDTLIPFGTLRDLPERVDDADIIIVTKSPFVMNDWEKTSWAENLGLTNFRTSTCTGTNKKGKSQVVLFTYINYSQPVPIFSVSNSRYIYSKRMILFTGIAKDGPLRSYLSDSYDIVWHHSFPDHHKYTWSDFQRIRAAARKYPTAAIATTEKDAQRVLDYNHLPEDIKEKFLMIPIKVQFLSENETRVFREKLSAL